MTWVTDKTALINLLTALDYSRIPENLTGEESDKSQEDFTYTLELGSPDTEELTSNATLNSDLVILTVYYFNASTEEYDANYDNFISVCSSIKDLTNYRGTERIEPFERISPEQSKGTIQFYFGDYVC
jgi:hypothetical protein